MIKNIQFIVLVLLCLQTQGQVRFETSLTDAFEKAQIEKKLVFIEYYNSDCSVCKSLGELLKKDTLVEKFYNKNFINYALNTKEGFISQEEQELLDNANLHFEYVPALLYFDRNNNFIHHSGVYVTAEHVINEGKKAYSADYRTSGLKAKYDNGDRTVRTLYAYASLLKIHKNDSLLRTVNDDLFVVFSKDELPTQKSYIILKEVINSTENGFFQYWMNNLYNLKGFEMATKEGTEKSYLEKIVLKELNDNTIKNWDISKKDKFKEYILKLKITDNPEVYFE
jgi:thiol-disulfide isomerase/thioredoxin